MGKTNLKEVSVEFEFDYIDSTQELVKRKSPILKKAIGQKLLASYVVWDIEEDEWFTDGVVVLQFEQLQLELCCNKMEEISVKSSSVDLLKRPKVSWDPEGAYEWRKNVIPEVNSVIGGFLESLRIVETEFCSWPMGEAYGSPNMVCTWILNGLNLYFSNGYFAFFNALDENDITNEIERDIKLREFDLNGKIDI
jgi:hypothetical protein